MAFSIPAEINSFDRLRTAEFYHRDLGWAIHALCPPNSGPDHKRGKNPIAKGWRSHTAAEVTPDYLREHFANSSNFNLGVVVRGPFVHVDLDSKPDGGESVRKWLADQPHLAAVPRERTGGGAHLVFICRDLPEPVAQTKKAISTQINGGVTAELYTDGMNLVVSPSVHKSGVRYEWDVFGEIPEVSWTQIRGWFGFNEPAQSKRGRPRDEKAWWARFKGELHTLDAQALLREAGLLGECIEPDAGKWSVRCPWEGAHSDANGGNGFGSDTVMFQRAADGGLPGFKCLHAHCADRAMMDVLCALDDKTPGIVDRHCGEMRVWLVGQKAQDGRPRVLLPGIGRPASEFAAEMGRHIAPRKAWFNKADAVVAVAMRQFSEKIVSLTFQQVQPVEACTAAEQFVETGLVCKNKETGDMVFRRHSMSREISAKLLAALQLRRELPEIVRILDVPVPILKSGSIVFPEPGYDPRFRSYLDPAAPQIRPMPFKRALELLNEVHADFGWKDAQSLVHGLARIITPFCRGLMGWDARFPLWHFSGNRPRAGKDYLSGVTQIIYHGRTTEDAPLERESEETRKRITAALMAGRRIMHFANCQGFIQDAVFIGAITSKTFAARNLGSTEAKADLTLPNEIEFSLSANVGLTFREDVEPRTRKISLVFYEENPNGRAFSKPDLHGWVMEHRSELLSAVAALVNRWMDCGRPEGPTPFNSYPEWGKVVGGIMRACGLGDPCLPHLADAGEIGGDRQDRAMRALYRLMFGSHPDTWIDKAELFRLVDATDDEDLAFFGSFDEGHSKDTKTRIGKALRQFSGRELCGVKLEIDARGKGDRQQVRFRAAETADQGRLQQITLSVFGRSGTCGRSPSSNLVGENKDEEKKEKERELKIDVMRAGVGSSRPSSPSMILTRAEFAEIAAAITAAGSVALDVETFGARKSDGLNPWRGDIRLLSLKIPGADPWLIDLQSTGYDLGPLAVALGSVLVIAHNLKFDALWLAVKCGVRLRRVFCTLTAARLLSAGTRPGNDLNKCLERYLEIQPSPDHSTSDWGGMFVTDAQLAYAARDVAHLHALYDVLTLKLEQSNLGDVAELEMQLLPVVIAMEQAGMAVDRAKLESIRDQAKADADAKVIALRELLSDRQLNVSSPAQLQAALAKAGLTLANTNEETLKANGDTKFVPIILAHRSAEKVAQQAQSLIECIASDGRIHGRFDPTGTATGRFSSKEPNLQNIGRGPLRECFIAPEGSKLVVADYSQIELRAAADIAGETKMIEAYRRGEDLHKATAAAVLGKAVEAITKEDRQLAKAVNFGLLYGQSAPGLVRYAASGYGVTLPEKDAQEIRAKFFRTYSRLRQWHGESHRKAEQSVTEIRTVLGRRRLIPQEASAWERFTALVNTPVQGGCADGMKRALVQLSTALPASARIISTVHDEIIVEVAEGEAEDVRGTVQKVMIEAMAALFPKVPVEVEAHVCRNWGEK